jgi:biotin carboxyl carrier protein
MSSTIIREEVAVDVAPPEVYASAEVTTMRERIVVSPGVGRFRSLPPESFASEGEWVEPGDVLGEIRDGESTIEVRSTFRGWMMGMLALDGQPVRQGEALFWIWSC